MLASIGVKIMDTWIEVELNNIMLMLGCECALWQDWQRKQLYCDSVRQYRYDIYDYFTVLQ